MMIEGYGSGAGSIPLTNGPDPGGPKTCGSGGSGSGFGSGSATLLLNQCKLAINREKYTF
jgi:hypothetical protein